MREINKNPTEAETMPKPQETILTKFERKKEIIKRLNGEFRELYSSDKPMIFDLDEGPHEEPQQKYKDADIIVQVRKGDQVDEIRGYLSSQNDFKLVREGKGIVLSADNYITFHLKLNDKEKPRMSLDKLKVLMNYLDSIGLYGSKYMRSEEKVRKSLLEGSTVPLTLAGRNGIRLTYNKAADKLEVIFVEGFDDPTFPLRKRVETWLKENF